MTVSHFNGVQRLCKCTNLIYFNQDGITAFFSDSALQELNIGYKQIITNQLTAIANLFS